MRWTFDRIHDALSGVMDKLEDLRGWFNHLAWDYRDNWLLRDITRILNDLLYNPLWDLRQRVWDIRERFDDVGDFLVDLDIQDAFTEFIEGLSWSWSYFVDDPWGFVKDQAFKIDPTIYYWLDDPLQEVKNWIIKEIPNGWHLVNRPGEWVHWQIGGWWEGWYTFYHDPWGFVKNEAFKIDPTIYYWLDDPGQEIKVWLINETDWAWGLFDHPRKWVFDRVTGQLDEHDEQTTSWLYSFGEHVLRYFIEEVW